MSYFRPSSSKELWDLVSKSDSPEAALTKVDYGSPPRAPPTPPKKSFPYFVSGSVRELHESTYLGLVDLLLKKGLFFNSQEERRKAPYRFLSPQALRAKMDFKLRRLPLLQPGNPEAGKRELLKIVEFLIDFSPHPSHPFNVSKNSAGLDPYGILGDLLAATMSQAVLTYFLAPVFTLMEFEVYRQYRNLVGYAKEEGDGMFVPSHGLGNAFAIQLAVQEKCPSAKYKGLYGAGNPKFGIFVSDQADYGFEKYCIWEGLGSNACIRVRSDENGRMDLIELERKINKCIHKGGTPILVVATAGTNVLGAIDPIRGIAEVAATYGLWFHVDGHLAGSCLFSEKHKGRLSGIERSDSVLWSPDKMLAAPFLMSIIVTRKSRKLKEAFRLNSALEYLQEPFYDHEQWDTLDMTLQTTRRPDILKIWFMWKAKGRKGLSDQVDGTYRLAKHCISELQSRSPKFRVILPWFDSNLVCFYYVPKAIRRRVDFSNESHAVTGSVVKHLRFNKVTESIKNSLLKMGKMQISIGELLGRQELPKFFVMNLNNTALTLKDIRYMLDLIEYHGDRTPVTSPWRSDTNNWQFNQGENEDEEKSISSEPHVPPPPSKYPDYVSAPIESMHRSMFQEFFRTVLDHGTFFQDRRDDSPYHFNAPEDLLQKFPFSLAEKDTGSQGDGEGGYMPLKEIIRLVKDIIFYSAKMGHPYFLYQITVAIDPYTIIADYVASSLTSPMYTFEDGPVYTLMEKELKLGLKERVRYKEAAAMALVGGSLGNQLPIYLAYLKKFPKGKKYGVHGVAAQGVLFQSAAAHYSTSRGCYFQGIGVDNGVMVKVDDRGSMDVRDLRRKVKSALSKGQVPFMVCATVGTTVLGAYVPLEEIADICEEYGMWLHADGAYGGTVILSDNQRFRLNAIERADSFTFNPHKMLGSAIYSTNWITKHKDILREVAPSPSKQQFRLNPGLYDQRIYDHGETHTLTDRRPDVFKMWLIWKMKGTDGLQAHIDRAFELTNYAYKQLRKRSKMDPRFQSVIRAPPQCTNINFLFVPKELRGMELEDPNYRTKLRCVQNGILIQLLFNDKLALSVEEVGSIPGHLIFCLYNTCVDEADIDYFFKLVEYYGGRLDLKKIFATCLSITNTKE